MPGGDRTGPGGLGPRTGRQTGYCVGYDTPRFGRGLGRRHGGFGWRHRFYATDAPGFWRYGPTAPPPTREQEKEWLKAQATELQDELQNINNRLNELEQ